MPPAERTILHASTIALNGNAVVITGASGSGKSALALRLLAYGAELIADDRTEVWLEQGRVMADAPQAIRGLIEARGVGILKAQAAGPMPVSLVVDMDQVERDRLPPLRETLLLDHRVPVFHNPGNAHFAEAILLYLKGGGRYE